MTFLDSAKKGLMQKTFSVTIHVENKDLLLDPEDIISCYFIEDIYKFCMVGKLVFNDTKGFLEDGPFTGNEKITITYGETEIKNIIFDIWKMNKVTQLGTTDPTATSTVEVTFIDTVYELLTLRKYSKSWGPNTEISTILDHIVNKMCGLKELNTIIEETNSTLTGFAMPYWTPLQAMKWLIKRARGKITKTSGYLCYSNTYKKFTYNIRSLEWLFSTRNNWDSISYYFEHDDVLYENKILEWSLNGIDNTTTIMLRGGHWKGYNFEKKSLIDVEYKYSKGVDKSTLLGTKSLFPDISDTRTANILLASTSEDEIKRIIYNDWVKRYSVQQAMSFVVRGHEKRYAGLMIDVMWPAAERTTVNFNPQLSGKYLIKSVTHMFTGGDASMPYRQKIVCLKNAYHNSNMKVLYKATKINNSMAMEW